MMRSHKVIAMSAANAKDDALKWLRQFLGMSSALVLNVAGPRESKAPGIQARAKAFLEALLWKAAFSWISAPYRCRPTTPSKTANVI